MTIVSRIPPKAAAVSKPATGMVMAETIEGLAECPHCGRAKPGTVLLDRKAVSERLRGIDADRCVIWGMYRCTSCQNVVLAESVQMVGNDSIKNRADIRRVFPEPATVSATIPTTARRFLQDAQSSLHASSASILSSNSAIDAMLKEVGFPRCGADGRERSLYVRIEEAAQTGPLTKGMAEWAHAVRLDANDQRHADDGLAKLSDDELRVRAESTLKLAKAIGEFLFVIPAMVEAGKRSAIAPAGADK
jgi:hypothetical protein